MRLSPKLVVRCMEIVRGIMNCNDVLYVPWSGSDERSEEYCAAQM